MAQSDGLDEAPERLRDETYPILCTPTHGWTRDGATPYRPTVREVLIDVFDGIDVRQGPGHVLAFASLAFYLASGGAFVAFLVLGPRPLTIALMALIITWLSTIYNTVWFHRYCSHRAFVFARPWVRTLLLWTNPIFFREECYALPHHVHHARSDDVGDPYGPHVGRLGSFVSFEVEQRTNTSIPEWRYRSIAKRVAHIGFPLNDYATFQRTQSVEPVGHFLVRATFAQLLYTGVTLLIGGVELWLTWYASTFVFLTLLRDFNWIGHGGRRANQPAPNRPGPSYARNQGFYGFVAGEWHGNHHLHPRSARCGIGRAQPDLAFAVIRLLHRIGVVASYRDDVTKATGETRP